MVGIVWSYEGNEGISRKKGTFEGGWRGYEKCWKREIDIHWPFHEKVPWKKIPSKLFRFSYIITFFPIVLADLLTSLGPRKEVQNDSKTTMNLQQLQLKIPQKQHQHQIQNLQNLSTQQCKNFTIKVGELELPRGYWSHPSLIRPLFNDDPVLFAKAHSDDVARPNEQSDPPETSLWWCPKMSRCKNVQGENCVFF